VDLSPDKIALVLRQWSVRSTALAVTFETSQQFHLPSPLVEWRF
jgi:hypothetical protein